MAECFPFWTAFNKTTELDFCLSVNPWDIATATYDNVSYALFQDGINSTRSLDFKPDGAKLYVGSNSSNGVFDAISQYTLTTPWDINTLVYISGVEFSVTTEDGEANAISFKPDGTKLFLGGGQTKAVYQYTLATPWDLTTITYDNVSFSVATEVASLNEIVMKPDGTKMYAPDFLSGLIHQYTLATPWNLSTITYDNVSFNLRVVEGEGFYTGVFIKPDGTRMYAIDNSANVVRQYTLGTPWDITTATYDNISYDVSDQSTALSELLFKLDGTKMYVKGLNELHQYTL